MSIKNILISVIALTLFGGCAYTAGFKSTENLNKKALTQLISKHPQKKPEDIEILHSTPTKPYVIIGSLKAPQIEWTKHYTMQDLLDAMRSKASDMGADAIINIRSVENPNAVIGIGWATVNKGLYAFGEAIVFTSDEEKAIIEGGK